MANYEGINTKTGIAGTAITKFRFVVLAADGQMDHVGTAQSISPDGVSAGEQATVGGVFPYASMDGGKMKVEAGAAVAVGALVASDNVGRGITFVDAAGNIACGRALTIANNAGEIFEVELGFKKTGAGT